MSTDDKTPIMVVTGFLGSGKTTLVNYILKEQKEWKIAVLENEFGEVAIDDGLVAESLDAPEDLITMDNGCVCCSVRGDLIRTLGQLSAQRKKFDTILLETTGKQIGFIGYNEIIFYFLFFLMPFTFAVNDLLMRYFKT